jgi:hypothetical protein
MHHPPRENNPPGYGRAAAGRGWRLKLILSTLKHTFKDVKILAGRRWVNEKAKQIAHCHPEDGCPGDIRRRYGAGVYFVNYC